MRTPTFIRRAASVAAMTMVAAVALVAPATIARADAPFAITGVSGMPATITTAASDATYTVTLNYTGPATSDDIAYDPYASDGTDESISVVSSNSRSADTYKPSIFVNTYSGLNPGTPLTYTLKVDSFAQPGTYHVTLPIQQQNWATSPITKTDLSASFDFTINADPAQTLAQGKFSGWGKLTKKSAWTWAYIGPEYLVGAKISVYYAPKAKKLKWKVVASSTINAAGDAGTNSMFTGKKGAIRKKGYAYYAISAVPFSPAVVGPRGTIK